jgi:hypothetical protein
LKIILDDTRLSRPIRGSLPLASCLGLPRAYFEKQWQPCFLLVIFHRRRHCSCATLTTGTRRIWIRIRCGFEDGILSSPSFVFRCRRGRTAAAIADSSWYYEHCDSSRFSQILMLCRTSSANILLSFAAHAANNCLASGHMGSRQHSASAAEPAAL